MKIFKDRIEAGAELAKKLDFLRSSNGVVFAIPRGGVVIGYEIAKSFSWPLDVVIARKIGAPFQQEFGIGAVAEGGIIVWDPSAVAISNVDPDDLEELAAREIQEVERRAAVYRGEHPRLEAKDKTVVLADDGLATGITAIAAIRSLKQHEPESIILAAPVCAQDTLTLLKQTREADDVVCVSAPADFYAVGLWYERFEQLADDDVIRILRQSSDKP